MAALPVMYLQCITVILCFNVGLAHLEAGAVATLRRAVAGATSKLCTDLRSLIVMYVLRVRRD